MNRVRGLHRELSRKKPHSRNWFKAEARLARAYEHLTNFRRDLYYRIGKYLAVNYDVVVMEDMRSKQLMGKSSRRLRMRLHDVGFTELRRIIQYQLEKHGKQLVLVDPAYTSKTCARCGYVRRDLTLSDRVFVCPRCGWRVDRDYNASLTVLERAGWEPPLVPVELRPIPLEFFQGQGWAGKQEAPPLKAG